MEDVALRHRKGEQQELKYSEYFSIIKLSEEREEKEEGVGDRHIQFQILIDLLF